jgi:hypothetical protein
MRNEAGMKSLFCAGLAAALLAAVIPAATKAQTPPAGTGTTLLTGTISKTFLKLKKGSAVKMVEVAADGSEIDLVAANDTLQFFFDPATKSWPREIERIVEHPAGGKVRGGFSHGEVVLKGNVASFSGRGFIPIGPFNFTVQ